MFRGHFTAMQPIKLSVDERESFFFFSVRRRQLNSVLMKGEAFFSPSSSSSSPPLLLFLLLLLQPSTIVSQSKTRCYCELVFVLRRFTAVSNRFFCKIMPFWQGLQVRPGRPQLWRIMPSIARLSVAKSHLRDCQYVSWYSFAKGLTEHRPNIYPNVSTQTNNYEVFNNKSLPRLSPPKRKKKQKKRKKKNTKL